MVKASAEQSAALEAILDLIGADGILDAISDIAFAKAEHVRSNWQDDNLSANWEAIGARVEKLSHEISEEFLSWTT
jgi:2-keto-3-deoxy-L-rhamnonate aldolase RhmA